MNAKQLKDLIFRKSRPVARRLTIVAEDKFTKDAGILWAAYQAGSFTTLEAGLTQEQFMQKIEVTMNSFNSIWILDDDCKQYSTGRGPIGIVGTTNIGLIVEPIFTFFKWASCRNILKSIVAFLNMIRRSEKTGIVLMRTDDKKRRIIEHMKKYYSVLFIGKSADNEYLYSIRGRGGV